MMYTDSEQSAIDILNAMNMKTKIPEENKRESVRTRKETRYEKWKRSKKSTYKWWFCCWL